MNIIILKSRGTLYVVLFCFVFRFSFEYTLIKTHSKSIGEAFISHQCSLQSMKVQIEKNKQPLSSIYGARWCIENCTSS